MPTSAQSYLALVREFPLRPLRSERDLDLATKVIDRLSIKPRLERGERDYLDVLADLIVRYEDRHHAIEPLADDEMLRFLITQSGKSQFQIAQQTGIANSTISAVLRGKRELTRRQIAKLSSYFNVAPQVFLVRSRVTAS